MRCWVGDAYIHTYIHTYIHNYTYIFFSSSNDVYQGFGYQCNGDEPSLASCLQTGAVVSPDYGIAVTCAATAALSISVYALSLFCAVIAAYIVM